MRTVYDWEDADVWRALHENKWDYNQAYDVMYRLGVNRNRLRIAPPTMSAASVDTLSMAQAAWPRWFDRVAKRLPGVRTAAQFGKRAVTCSRRLGDTWEETYRRECIDRAPAPWLAARATAAMENRMGHHSGHANTPFPDVNPCRQCNGSIRCWKDLCLHLYNGDPFSLKATFLPYIEPEFFRQGAGTWDGKPSW